MTDPREAPRSIAFLVPIEPRDGGLAEFARNFLPNGLGYDAVFISDYYGLASRSDDAVLAFVQRTLANAQKFEREAGVRPRLVLDVKGFRLNSNRAIRELAEASPYVWAYHVVDEPDAHLTGDPDVFRATPEEIDELLRGADLGPYGKPLLVTFENQAGRPDARKWSYVKNTDELYLRYMAVLDRHHPGPNYFGIDYYLFNRSLTPPADQRTIFDMMSHYWQLVWRAGTDHRAFAWTETTLQGLEYIGKDPRNQSRPITPDELWAQIWLYWAAGQRGWRGDFNYIFDHLFQGHKTWNPDGLNHPYYAKHKAVVQRANRVQREVGVFLDQPGIPMTASDDMVKVGLRYWFEGRELRVLVIAVNIGAAPVPAALLVTHPILHGLGELEVVGEDRGVKFQEQGLLMESFGAYQVHLYRTREVK